MGYISANLIIGFGNYFGVVIAVFIINALVMYFQNAKKYFLDSIPAIFIGIALTFSGAGIALKANNLSLLWIILIYGVLGLLCGYFTNIFVNKLLKK